ncbi:MAG: ribonuclease R [Clostridia bacterium]|nr:ribonuclease R [Clostridia bacterium]
MNFKESILKVFESGQKYFDFDEIAKALGLSRGFDRQALASALSEMVKADQIVFTKRNKYTLADNSGAIKCTIIGSPNGYSYARPASGGLDIFISERDLEGASHGDTVLVKILGKQKGRNFRGKTPQAARGRTIGRVIRILARGFTTIVGTYAPTSGGGLVVPDDARFADSMFIPANKANGASGTVKVVVKITEYPTRTRMAQGEVIEVLGDARSFKVSTLSVIRSFGLIDEFPENVVKEADKLNVPITENQIKGRKDFRNELTITIDGEDARDFDDAISLKMKGENYVLSVHIADVGEYVKQGGVIDKEAFRRGTSVYFPDYVIPMLPKSLSNGICSLNPNEDRLTLSVVMEFDKDGNIKDYNFFEGVIRSAYRMTYTNVTKIFDGDSELCHTYKEIVPMLKQMAKLAVLLLERRNRAGQLDFDLPEAQIDIDEEGRITSITQKPRNLSDRLIEQFMVVTNEVVANHFDNLKLPFVFRVHEEPTYERVKAFRDFVSSFGLKLQGGVDGSDPKDFQKLLLEIQDTPYSQPISKVMLRSMQKARYDSENLGHFGLALRDYCHFTSPIRRYPDLTIHRIIKLYLRNKLTMEKLNFLGEFVKEAADQSSLTERNAETAEREVDDLKKAEYMRDKIGEIYEGNISGVTDAGLFVQLDNTIEGFIYLENLPEDHYIFDQTRYMLVGRRNRFMLGERLKIRVAAADINTRHIDFEICNISEDSRKNVF